MPFLAISLVSAGAIGYEILLMRLYAIGQWHNFAYMIISIALLGYGASGTFLALARGWLLTRYHNAWSMNAGLFGLTAAYGYAIARNFMLNPFELAWDPLQGIVLLWTYLVLMVPFFCAANCVGLAFMRYSGGVAGDTVGRVYRYDLIGAGLGAAAVMGLLFILPASESMRLLIVLGFAAAGLAHLGSGQINRRRRAVFFVLCGVLIAWLESGATFAPQLSQYKGLSYALNLPGAEVIHESSSPLGQLTVVRSPQVPFRHAPGLSFNSPVSPPEQLGLFIDGDAMTAITRFDDDPRSIAYLDFTTRALPYHLLEQPTVLILGAGAADEALLARSHGASWVEVAEPDPGVIALLQGRFAEFAGNVYDPARTTVYPTDARGALALAGSGYDLIRLPVAGAAAGGFGALQETYAATVEAFVGYLGRLKRGGLLAVNATLEVPPRAALKLFATAVAAMERMDVAEPGRRLVLIRGFKTVTLLVKRNDFTAAEIEIVRGFAEDRAFDLAYAPGMARAEANRFNVLDEPYLYDGAMALIGPRRTNFMADYKFNLRPASDDRPYFFDFLKWRTLPELLALSRQGAMPLIEWGYLILLATLVQALVVSLVLIIVPLAVWHHRRTTPARGRARVAAYFLALGLAFLFVEIAFIQRLTLFLGHPLYAVAVVLAAFLMFAGLGAGLSPRLAARLPEGGRVSAVEAAVAAIAAITLTYLVALAPMTEFMVTLSIEIKLPLALAAIAPLAFCMGMPFPLGLARVGRELPQLVPWAWGINGCASVVSAVLATLLAIEFGFTAVVALAVALYVVAAAVWRGSL